MNSRNYASFLDAKFKTHKPCGFRVDPDSLPHGLFPHQSDLVQWSIRKGASAIFADTGLGKSRMEIAFADAVRKESGRDVLILTPLAVAPQMVEEGRAVGVEINHVRDDSDVRPGISVTNYDRLHRFDTDRFAGVVLDESSCIKHHNSKTLQTLLDTFQRTPYKLAATATPAPNDWSELGTHAEFLGVRSRTEMLAEFFIHDGGDTQSWRLKGHARAEFWRWVASWGALIRSPADLGHDASAYVLPALHFEQHTVENDAAHVGPYLFEMEAQTLMERRDARRASMAERVKACADMVNADQQPWIVWCDLNAEGDALQAAIPGAVQVSGADDMDVKEQRLMDFAAGKFRVLITKASIAGWGCNWQHCARVAFVGVTDSFEAFYQAVRRCWRFGQKREVWVHAFASKAEGAVVSNLRRKEADARLMSDALSAETLASVRAEIFGVTRETNIYAPAARIVVPSFLELAA